MTTPQHPGIIPEREAAATGYAPVPVALAATLHDPTAADLPNLLTALPDLRRRYAGLVVSATDQTPTSVLIPLRDAGAHVTVHPIDLGQIGWRRLMAVRDAATLAPAVHLCDFDRLLHWWRYWPEELTAIVATIPTVDLLILGRTDRAWATHPANQVETEQLANRIVSHYYGAPVDICSGSRGLSTPAIAYLTAHSCERTVGTDAEWPLRLHHAGFRCEQVLTEGLEFETGDRFPEEVARRGGLASWNAANDRDPARWIFRVRLASEIAEAAVRTAMRLSKQ